MAFEERFPGLVVHRPGLVLIQTRGLRFNNRVIPPEQLEQDAALRLPPIEEGDDDKDSLRKVLQSLPLAIIGESAADLLLETKFRSFSLVFPLGGKVEEYLVRMMPLEGNILRVIQTGAADIKYDSDNSITMSTNGQVRFELELTRDLERFSRPILPGQGSSSNASRF
jgi:hypothetical protein